MVAGFSTIELLAVLVVLALATTLVTVRIGAGGDRLSLSAVAGETASLARRARDLAITSGRSTLVAVDLGSRTVTASGAAKVLHIPREVEIEATFAGGEAAGATAAGVRFFPDGASSGGTIRLGQNGSWYEVRISWFTGRVHVLAPERRARRT